MPLKHLPEAEALPKRIASGLGRLALAVKARAWRGAADEGITPTQGELLARLHEQPEGMRLGDLALQLGISAPTASDAVATLVSKSLMEKQQGPDKRSVTLRLTKPGRKVALRAADWTSFLAGSVETLAPQEQAAFMSSLMKIIRSMQEVGDISPQRMCVTCVHFRPFAYSDASQPHHCGFVDAAFGAKDMRLNCADHQVAEVEQQKQAWLQLSAIK
jgi:DNA-binding MarR family transcriptional regulator